ncbi:hypothetical protein FTX61_19970 [Nitriliruptoraceae bacterium ZYF776]|nr:hypothetical protein [Profundirhabdus halotolerans]
MTHRSHDVAIASPSTRPSPSSFPRPMQADAHPAAPQRALRRPRPPTAGRSRCGHGPPCSTGLRGPDGTEVDRGGHGRAA